MSLDSLFQQILLTEQQLTEQTQKYKDVKVAVIRCNEKIKSATEKYGKTKEELSKKAQQSSALRLQSDLTKKCEDQMLKQIEELFCQRNHLREHEATIRRESKEEEENFLQEISRFNSDFSLRENRATLFESQTHTELLALESEVESLHKEMELMSRRNGHMSSVEEEKRATLLELHGLENTQKDLDQQLKEAQVMTETLSLESQFVSQKHLSDNTCLRYEQIQKHGRIFTLWHLDRPPLSRREDFVHILLRKELEMHKDGELEHLRHTLGSQIQLLQSRMESSQENEQH